VETTRDSRRTREGSRTESLLISKSAPIRPRARDGSPSECWRDRPWLPMTLAVLGQVRAEAPFLRWRLEGTKNHQAERTPMHPKPCLMSEVGAVV